MIDKLKLLISKCKGGVVIYINNHKNNYEDVAHHLRYIIETYNTEIPHSDFDKMVETDTVVDVTFYPDTPIGSYQILSHDIDIALDRALDILNQGR